MRAARILSVILAGLMAAQAALGLLLPQHYRDVEWVRTTWFGNDAVSLVVALPLLLAGVYLERRGTALGRLLWLGMLGYGAYNYAFYLFGAALNVFFPLYVLAFVCSLTALVTGMAATDAHEVAARFRPALPARVVGGYLTFLAAGLTIAWLGMWAAHVFAGRPTPVEPEAFKLIAALDLTMMVPALATGGILLWRRHPWGYVVAALAAIQGSLYLAVLAANAVLFVRRGLSEGVGEVPVWGSLAVLTTLATGILLGNTRGRLDGAR